MANGYMEKFLYVDLSKRTVNEIPVPQWLMQRYIGGKGFGAKILYDLLYPGVEPLSPDNVLMFMTGPLTATAAPSMRACAVTKSPLTGTFLDSFFGGHFGPEIKYAGYDGIIITGKAESPVYLWIDDNKVEICPAGHLGGMDALEVNQAIKKELGDDSVKIVSIGPAGENLVKYALISCEYNRQAGRGGAGAVMGSKNLKGIALRGYHVVRVNDLDELKKGIKFAQNDLAASPDVQELAEYGTAPTVPFASENGLLPYKNYQDGQYEKCENLGNAGQSRYLWLKSAACMGCPIHCSKIGVVRTGKYAGTTTDIVEYESAAFFGSNLDISDIRAVAHLVKLCDCLGLDSMSAGAAVGFAMEACEKGIIDSPDNVKIDFGSVEAADYLVKAIAHRSDYLGNLLAEGVKRASERLSERSMEFAVHVKGLETPAWGPRGSTGMGLAFMTADRGGCHQRGLPLGYDIGDEKWKGEPVDPLSCEKKAEIVCYLQNYLAGTDTLVKCDFGGFGIQPATYARLLSAATGCNVEEDLFEEVGERIWNLTRLFNLREGIDYTQDRLPPRFVNEPLPSGPAKGHKISEEDMDYMRSDYYRVRGWSEKGEPGKNMLEKLHLNNENIFRLSK
ncbi:MAG: aldehyde ferredoxin oxidoreductase family protein [Clostridiales bacterium]|nr:aldehyde ferredoxin oxidoreductase family protein [Clostridiales bacterium]MCF8021467.1 aldehyde ferredoxin oxidoreductase family protein [Clostridiales bacterium]